MVLICSLLYKHDQAFLNADINQDDVFVKTHDQNQVHEMMLDPLLYKGVKLSEVNPTAAIQTAWSPPGVADVGYVGLFLLEQEFS